MKKQIFILVLALVATTSTSFAQFWNKSRVTPSGNMVETTHTLSAFHAIDISNAFDVNLVKSDKEKITIRTDEAFLPYIVVEEKQGKLHIYISEDAYLVKKNKTKNMFVTVQYKHLESIEVSGAVDVQSADIWEGKRLAIDCSGASELQLAIKCEDFAADISGASEVDLTLDTQNSNMEISGASDVRVEGNANSAQWDLSGASKVHVFKYLSKHTKANVSGASHLDIYASEKLFIDASGVSNVNYMGKANNTTISCSRLSKVQRK